MSKQDIMTILEQVRKYNQDNPELNIYIQHNFISFLRSKECSLWNKDIILSFLQKALLKGFHGIHFISSLYIPSIELILTHYFGNDNYIAYKICEKHNKICLYPNYKKLNIPPNDILKPSYDEIADFCFE